MTRLLALLFAALCATGAVAQPIGRAASVEVELAGGRIGPVWDGRYGSVRRDHDAPRRGRAWEGRRDFGHGGRWRDGPDWRGRTGRWRAEEAPRRFDDDPRRWRDGFGRPHRADRWRDDRDHRRRSRHHPPRWREDAWRGGGGLLLWREHGWIAAPPAHGLGGWRVGDLPPRGAWSAIVDWGAHGLPPPPRGHCWAALDGELVLIALGSGRLAAIGLR